MRSERPVVLVSGVTGQDGFFLAQLLLGEGSTVHGFARSAVDASALTEFPEQRRRFTGHRIDMLDEPALARLVAATQPDEIYNLAGPSSVSASFAHPQEAWRGNAEAVAILLEVVRQEAPSARIYQSSSGEMFGGGPDEHALHSETSAMNPQSPYAAAKAAAHLLCSAYRETYGLRVACGILFNHESHRRSAGFLSRKVIDHVTHIRKVGMDSHADPLRVGNLAAERDWGFAPDYVAGMIAILRQISVRAAVADRPPEPDIAANYRDYLLATGRLHAVWQLVDRAFALGGMELNWDMTSPDVADWCARFRTSDMVAVVVDRDFIRPSDPASNAADPGRARNELGWSTSPGLDAFLQDMLN